RPVGARPPALERSLAMRALFPVLLVAGLAVLLAAPEVHSAIFLFKDGFVVKGKLKRETSLIFDSVSGQSFRIPNGFYFVDDGARVTIFSPKEVFDTIDEPPGAKKN